MPSASKNRMSSSRDRLLEALAQALVSKESRQGPQVVVNPLPRLGKVDLVVTWDRWAKLSFETRSEIIRDAWEKVNPGKRDLVYTAIGRTKREQYALGNLPYYVEPAEVDGANEGLESRIHEAMLEEGAFETSSGFQARFESFGQAKEALVHLRTQIPEVDWVIVKEVATEG